jgi:hypothetical protein
VAPDEQSRRRDALGRPLTVGRIGYDHRAPAGIMAANHRTPATLVFAGDSWGRTGTRAFPGLEATPARDREPEEGKQPTAGTAKEPRHPAPAGAGLVESKLNTLPAIQPAKAQPPAPKAAQPRIPRKNQENVAP